MGKNRTNSIILKKIRSKKISEEAMSLLCQKFNMTLSAGLNEGKCADIISRQTENDSLKEILSDVTADINKGVPMSEAFRKNSSGKIPELFFEVLKAGENAGNLQNVFEKLNEYFGSRSKIKRKLKGALIYPVFVVSVAVIVLLIIMTYVMPKLTAIFEAMGGELPKITVILIAVSDFFSDNIIAILLSAAVAALLTLSYFKTGNGKKRFDKFKLKCPFIGKLIVFNTMFLFTKILSMLESSGVPLNKGLRITAASVENRYVDEVIKSLAKTVEAGRPLFVKMRTEEVFPEELSEMVQVGQHTGRLGEILDYMGDYYREMAASQASDILARLEPSLMIFIALIAGFIVVSVYLPMFNMYGLI